MERAVAIKRLGKLLGKGLGYRVDPKAPTQEDRDSARAEMKRAVTEREELKAKWEARRRAILDADQEYQLLTVAYQASRERADKLFSIQHHYKFTVGTSNGMFFHVRAQGDSWEQVIDKLSTEKQTA
jgi:hypothetical protein